LSSKKVVLQPAYPGEYQEKFFESFTVKDIPVVTNRSFFSEGEQELDDFLESASRLREAPVGILDLRGHRGGSDYLAGEWIANYTEQSPVLAACYSDLRTSTASKLMENRFRGDRNMLEQVRQRFAPREEGWSEMVYVPPEELESEGVLLVLVDNQVASAGESLIRLLMQVENVIFMGINTAGISHFGNVGLLHLPHSGLQVEMGVTLFFEPDLVFREGQGFEPDIWVDPTRALELGLIFLEKLIP